MDLNKRQREALENAADDLNLRLYKDYSGRGMYGKTCVGIVTDRSGFGVALDIYRYFVESNINDSDMDELLFLMADNCKQDSLGLESIFYFPRIQWDEEEKEGWEEEEDEDEDSKED